MVIVQSAGLSDVGRGRGNNEDSLLVDSQQNLFVVADGMGGHKAGDVASQMVIETIVNCMDGDRADAASDVAIHDDTLSEASNRLLSAIHLANQNVHQAAQEDATRTGMGATLSAVYFTDDILIAANVGDSPIYLIHEGAIEPLYVVHTVFAEREAVDPEGALGISEQYRHMLTRAMGTKETVVPDACEIPCFTGDILVICSDGLSNKVSTEEIRDIASNETPEEACQSFVDLANERGGEDNITVIIIKVESARGRRTGVIGWIMDTIRGLLPGL